MSLTSSLSPTPHQPLRIAQISAVAEGIRAFELVHPEGALLPAFTAGAHLQLQVPNGLLRKYSISSDPGELQHYVITVKREAAGRGGSLSLCDDARVGQVLNCSVPTNAFALLPARAGYLFIAGGIGITPILSMIRSLGESPPVPWTLLYLTRSRPVTAYAEELTRPALASRVRIHHDQGDPARALDLWPVLEIPGNAHVYCCGPRPLMESVRDMTGHWAPSQVHFESFVDGDVAQAQDDSFHVRLASSGQVLAVPAGQSILQVLRQAGHVVASSCESGTCGTCRTGLLAGQAEHRDMVLMPEEEDSQIMVCVSRSRGGELLLDL